MLLQPSSTCPFYFRMLGARVGHTPWLSPVRVRAGVEMITIGPHAHWGEESCLFTDVVTEKGVFFEASRFGEHCSMGQWVVAQAGLRMGGHTTVGAETLLSRGLVAEDTSTVLGCPGLMFKTTGSNAFVTAQTQKSGRRMSAGRRVSEDINDDDKKEEASKAAEGAKDSAPAAPEEPEGDKKVNYVHFYAYCIGMLVFITLMPTLMAAPFATSFVLGTKVIQGDLAQSDFTFTEWVQTEFQAGAGVSIVARCVVMLPFAYMMGAFLHVSLLTTIYWSMRCMGLGNFENGESGFFTIKFITWHIFSRIFWWATGTVLYPLAGTSFYTSWLRTMGAHIGKNVFISPETAGLRELNHMYIDDGAIVLAANVMAHYIDHDMLQFAPVRIGKNVRINVGCMVQPLTLYEEGCTLRAYTTGMKGMSFKAGGIYQGNPAGAMDPAYEADP